MVRKQPMAGQQQVLTIVQLDPIMQRVIDAQNPQIRSTKCEWVADGLATLRVTFILLGGTRAREDLSRHCACGSYVVLGQALFYRLDNTCYSWCMV